MFIVRTNNEIDSTVISKLEQPLQFKKLDDSVDCSPPSSLEGSINTTPEKEHEEPTLSTRRKRKHHSESSASAVEDDLETTAHPKPIEENDGKPAPKRKSPTPTEYSVKESDEECDYDSRRSDQVPNACDAKCRCCHCHPNQRTDSSKLDCSCVSRSSPPSCSRIK